MPPFYKKPSYLHLFSTPSWGSLERIRHNRAGLALGMVFCPATECLGSRAIPVLPGARHDETPGARLAHLGSTCYLGRVLAPENMASILGDLDNDGVVYIHHLARLLAIGDGVPLEPVLIKPPLDLAHNDGHVVEAIAHG